MSEIIKGWKQLRRTGERMYYYEKGGFRVHYSKTLARWVVKEARAPFKQLCTLPHLPDDTVPLDEADDWLWRQATQEASNPAFTPEPPPRDSDGIAVWPHLIRTLQDPGNTMYVALTGTPEGEALYGRWIAAMQARHEDGVRKYGKPLTTHNGRNALVDALQESLDKIVYVMQAELEGELERACQLFVTNNPVLAMTLQQLRAKITVDARLLSFLLFALVDAQQWAPEGTKTP